MGIGCSGTRDAGGRAEGPDRIQRGTDYQRDARTLEDGQASIRPGRQAPLTHPWTGI